MKAFSFVLTCCSLVLLNSAAFSAAPVTGEPTNDPPSLSEVPEDLALSSNYASASDCEARRILLGKGASRSTNSDLDSLVGTSKEAAPFTTPTDPLTELLQQRERNLRRVKESRARIAVGNRERMHFPRVEGGPLGPRDHVNRRKRVDRLIVQAAPTCMKEGESEKDCRKRLRQQVYPDLEKVSSAEVTREASRIIQDLVRNRNSATETLLESPPKKRRKINADSLGGTSTRPAPIPIDSTPDLESLKILDDSAVDTILRLGSLGSTSTRPAPIPVDSTPDLESLKILDDSDVDTILRLGRI